MEFVDGADFLRSVTPTGQARLLSGEAGVAAIDASRAWMKGQAVACPERMVRLIAPWELA